MLIRPLLFAVLGLSLSASQAQSDLANAKPLPTATATTATTTTTAPTPSIKYCSAFEQYRTFKDEDVADWKKTNAAVMQAGGWRAYAREARQPEPTQATSANANANPNPNPNTCPPGIRTVQRTTEESQP